MSALDIQVAVFNRIVNETGFSVYDDVPKDAVLPYVVIGNDTSIDFDTNDSVGEESTITVHTWSKYSGMKEVKLMQQAIKNALNRVDLTINNTHLITCNSEYQSSELDPDGVTRHGVQRFRFLTMEQG